MENNELGNKNRHDKYNQKLLFEKNNKMDKPKTRFKKKRHKHQHKESGEDTTRDMEEMMLKKK